MVTYLVGSSKSMRMLPWLVATTVLAIGVVWRDFVLIACSALFALHAFQLHMDSGAPWQVRRVALRCWLMGVASLFCGFAMWAIVGFAQMAWWTPANSRPAAVYLILPVAAAICLMVRSAAHQMEFRLVADLLVPAAVMLTLAASTSGWEEAPLLFAVFVALAVTHNGWRHLRGVGAMWLVDDRS